MQVCRMKNGLIAGLASTCGSKVRRTCIVGAVDPEEVRLHMGDRYPDRLSVVEEVDLFDLHL